MRLGLPLADLLVGPRQPDKPERTALRVSQLRREGSGTLHAYFKAESQRLRELGREDGLPNIDSCNRPRSRLIRCNKFQP